MKRNRNLIFVVFLFQSILSSCQDIRSKLVVPDLEISYQLGGEYFPFAKDTTSYLPDELIYDSSSIFFMEKFGRDLIEYNINSKATRIINSISDKVENYKARKLVFNSVRQVLINSANISVLFGDRLFRFDRKTFEPNAEFELKPYAYCVQDKNAGYINISQSGSHFDHYSATGIFFQKKQLRNALTGFFVAHGTKVYCSNSISVTELFYDSLLAGTVMERPLLFNSEERQKYVLMSANPSYLVWSDLTDINRIILTDIESGKISRIYEIDKGILKYADVTKDSVSDAPSADPPELRQYLRITVVEKKLYLMFQAKGYLKLYSFNL